MASIFRQIQIRRGESALFSSVNPVLGSGEPAITLDDKKFKIGDGTTQWMGLPHLINSNPSGAGNSTGSVSGVNNMVILDEETFDSISSKDPQTIYFIPSGTFFAIKRGT